MSTNTGAATNTGALATGSPVDTGAPSTLDPATLQHLLASGDRLRLIDVRAPGEFEAAHIPGSHNVPLDVLREHRDELRAHLDDHVVLVCHSGQRATAAEQALAAAGLPNLRVLAGGISAWQGTGAPVRAGKPRWELERQVRLVAGSIVLASILTSVVFSPAKWMAGFISAGLTFAALTNSYAMGLLVARLPYNRSPKAYLDAVVAALAGSRP